MQGGGAWVDWFPKHLTRTNEMVISGHNTHKQFSHVRGFICEAHSSSLAGLPHPFYGQVRSQHKLEPESPCNRGFVTFFGETNLSNRQLFFKSMFRGHLHGGSIFFPHVPISFHLSIRLHSPPMFQRKRSA